MPLYDVTVYVQVYAENPSAAYRNIERTLGTSKDYEILYRDAEVTSSVHGDSDDADEAYERAASRARSNDFEDTIPMDMVTGKRIIRGA